MGNVHKSDFLKSCSVLENGELIIFGGGVYGVRLYKMFKILSIATDAFFDNNPEKWGKSVADGIECKNPADALGSANETLVVVAVKKDPELIKADLNSKGFPHVVLMRDIESNLSSRIDIMIDSSLIDLISFMAESGVGTDKCIEAGALPVKVHFYQPIPDIKDLERRDVWSKASGLEGLDWNHAKFMSYLKDISGFRQASPWPSSHSGDAMEYNTDNTSFSYLCASLLYSTILKNKPKRIIEIGSGNSTKVILKAISDISAGTAGYSVNYTVIDPWCTFDQLHTHDRHKADIIRMPVEETDISLFKELGAGDILFVDSSHTVRIGGDVNFEILDILPILASGVIVHFHDIPMPYEYPKIYAKRSMNRMFWTESYLLQAFLAFNSVYEILLPVAYVCGTELETVKKYFPGMTKEFDWSSSSFWMRRK